jgi:RNA polymerase sigma-70 factor, ECF subfamily
MADDLVTLLAQWNAGSVAAGEKVVSKTYDELRRLARAYLRRERAEHTLQATALLNEAYLHLLPSGPRAAATREEFFRLMASEMRHRLVDHARRRLADKRGGGVRHDTLDTQIAAAASEGADDATEMLDKLDRAIDALAGSHPRIAQIVQLRFIGGLTIDEVAADLGVSSGTVKRDWTFAKAWLAAAIEPQ